jgi:hypothetical protein
MGMSMLVLSYFGIADFYSFVLVTLFTIYKKFTSIGNGIENSQSKPVASPGLLGHLLGHAF